MSGTTTDAFSGTTPTSVLFLHIAKTAGTTLNRILDREYSTPASYQEPSGGGSREGCAGVEAMTESERRRFRVFSGHFPFGVQHLLPPPVFTITLLRDPLERVLSQYYHVARTPDHYLHQRHRAEEGPLLSLTEFLSAGTVEVDNWQTRVLAGPEAMALPFGACGRDVLEQAKKNLACDIALAGLTERFDETVVLLWRRLGWIMPCYLRENVGWNRRGRDEVPREALRLIWQRTQWDRELYDFAAARLEEQIARQGVAFADDVRRFRIANVRYRRLKALIHSRPLRPLRSLLSTGHKIGLDATLRTVFGQRGPSPANISP